MQDDKVQNKLEVLADAAKFDVSCASSGSKRKNTNANSPTLTRIKIHMRNLGSDSNPIDCK